MARTPFSEEMINALRIIFGLDEGSAPPANLNEVVRRLHPELQGRTGATQTREYQRLARRFQRQGVQKWLQGIFSKYPEGPLKRCSPGEKVLAEELRERYPNGGCYTLCGKIQACLGGSRDRFHVGERHG